MASATLKVGGTFPVGTSVSAYPVDSWDHLPRTGAASLGAAADTATVENDSTVAFGGLDYNKRYVAYAEVSGSHNYVRFSTPPDDEPESLVQAIYNPRSYGAQYDGETDDSAAIQAAIDACSEGGGGIVDITGREQIQGVAAGDRVRIDETIIPRSSVWIRGRGAATALVGDADPMIALPTSGVIPDRMAITDLFLQAPVGDGIVLDMLGTTGGLQLGWPRLTLQNITVTDAAGRSFYSPNNGGPIEVRYINCVSMRAGGIGFELSATDLFLLACTAAAGSAHGFSIAGGNNKFASCKAYGNAGTGFNVSGSGRHVLAGCESQDNYVGYNVDSQNNNITGLADTSRDVGVKVSGNDNDIDVVSTYGGGGSGWVTPVGFMLSGTFGIKPIRNRIRGTTNSAAPVGGHTAENDIDVKIGAGGIKTVGYAATITPDPYLGTPLVVLTGNVAIAAPSNSHVGQRLRLILTQDGTGSRTMTFASAYRTSWTPDTAASKTNIIEFQFDGRYWRQTSAATGLTSAPLAIADSFTRVDAGTPGTATSGESWTVIRGGIGIVSNKAGGGTGFSNFGINAAVIEASVADVRVSATWGAAGEAGIVVRATDGNNFIYVTTGGLNKVESGTASGLATTSMNMTSGDIMTVETSGASILVYKNGTLQIAHATPFNQAATKHGVYLSAPTDCLDDFAIV